MVNGHLPTVNTHLPQGRYVLAVMARTTKKKPGPKKGVPKPNRESLDKNFPLRLRQAMERRGYMLDGETLNAALAKEVKCTRQTIGQYLNADKPKKSMDAGLLLDLCDELWVTPYWLVRSEGTIDDVPKHKIPMQDVRRKAKQSPRGE
jgi:hypothetical protein